MPSPDALPIEARLLAWQRLWERLLADPPADDEPEPNQDSDDGEEIAA